jgi:DNA-binding transcriptional MerR regulator
MQAKSPDKSADPAYSLDELCQLTEFPPRTVRYYMQLGLVDRPEGETRAARYGSRHLEQLLAIKKWTRAGLSLERIGELLKAGPDATTPPPKRRGSGTVEVWSHLVVADGLEMHIEPGQAGLTPEQVRELFRRVMAIYQDIKKDNDNES